MNFATRAVIIWATVSVLFFSCDEKKKPDPFHRIGGSIAGFDYQVVYGGDTTDYAHAIDSIFKFVENTFSPHVPGSIISRYNKFQRTDTMFCFVDPQFLFGTVFDMSNEVWKKTQRYFDPTTGPMKKAWSGVGLLRNGTEPNLDSLFEFVGYDETRFVFVEQFGEDNKYRESQLRKHDPRIELDFGKFAYAYALDMAGAYLQERGIRDFRLTLDDIVLCYGFENDTTSAITLTAEGDSLRLSNQAIAIKEFEDKKSYVDPTYGYPIIFDPENTKEYVYVLAPSAVFAEAYAQAFMIMGTDEITAFYDSNKQEPIEVLLLDQLDSQWLSSFTPAFGNALINTAVIDTLSTY
ncbi:MAG: FAD:protein FMN transferase [Flavobacteriales bacterium]|nr:FAD:protein FMN transferase [Flavobacteriales bacterium]